MLRAVEPAEVADAAAMSIERCRALGGDARRDVAALLRVVFNGVSLSPYTAFVNNTLAWVQALVRLGAWSDGDEVDFLSWLLRQLSRHLTAYDLVTFHHRGANYPDALLLDAALRRFLALVEQEPKLFTADIEGAELRRRALRQGLLLRRTYEGLAVPDAPTSPGENTRVLPAPFVRVPEEQLVNPPRRERRLFDHDSLLAAWTPTTKKVLRQSLEDMNILSELVELGTATFIDRPLGFGKERLEPDQTPLLAHEAYSQAVARRRMDLLADMARAVGVALPSRWGNGRQLLDQEAPLVEGLGIAWCTSLGRPVATLADARRVSEDFQVMRLLPSSVQLLRASFDWDALDRRFPLKQLWQHPRLKCVRAAGPGDYSVMTIWDDSWEDLRLKFESDPSQGYRSRGGVELPVAGLRIWMVRDDDAGEHDLRGENVYVGPRWE